MKDFVRNNQLLSLCGLNCGLCSMKLGGHCSGCGCGNQSCKIAKCSIEHGKPEYCFQCTEYPCSKYENIDEYDSFITHKNQKADLLKAQNIGIDAYNAEQAEKVTLLNILLADYNAGREKTLYCLAVNLLEVNEIKSILEKVEENIAVNRSTLKEKAACTADLLRETAQRKDIELKLRKK